MPAAIPEATIKAVRDLWAEDRSRSARAIHEHFNHLHGEKTISQKKVNDIVQEAIRNAPTQGMPTVEWEPWKNPEESSEDVDHLLRLDAVCRVTEGRPMHEHEAAWGRRLRVALETLSPYHQFRFTQRYALRQVIAFNLNEAAYTADLDGLVVYKPWLSDSWNAYAYALTTGAHPPPLGDPREEGPQEMLAWFEKMRKGRIVHISRRVWEPSPRRTPLSQGREEAVGWMLDNLLDFWTEVQPEEPHSEGEENEG